MDIRMAEYLMAIERTGSITRAARSLYISQPALSQSVRRLESELGTEVLERSGDPLTLTYAGHKYLDAMKKISAIQNDLINELSEIAGEARGQMRLGISMQRSMQLLPLVLPTFTRLHPHVRIHLEEHGSGTLEKMLHDGKCDLALITTSPRYEDLSYLLLETEEVVLMASKETALARSVPDGSLISLSEAADEQFVVLGQGHSVRAVQDQLFMQHHFSPRILLETENLEAAKRLAALGSAVMLCPDVFIVQSPEVRSLVHCYHLKGLNYKRHFYLAYRKDLYFTRFMQDFLDILRDTLKRNQPANRLPDEEK